MKYVFTKRLATIIAIEHQFPKSSQDRYRGTLLLLISSSIGIIGVDTYYTDLLTNTAALWGGLAVFSGLYLEAVLLLLYSNSAYYSGLASKTGRGNYRQTGITYDVAKVLHKKADDITGAFLSSTFGAHIYVRCGLTHEEVAAWCMTNRQHLPASILATPDNRPTTLTDVIDAMLIHDSSFVQLLHTHGITADTFRGAGDLILLHYYTKKRRERWWSRDTLGSRGSLGRSLTLGAWREYVPYTIALPKNTESPTEEDEQYLTHFSEVLQSRRDSNLIIVAPDQATSHDLLGKLQHQFEAGTTLGAINSMSLIRIDHHSLLSNHPDTVSVEAAIRIILTEATQAGNMTIVIDDIVQVMSEYRTRGVLFTHILEEFLTADRVHVILTTTPAQYAILRKESLSLVKRCHETIIEPLSTERMMQLLGSIVFTTEEKYDTIVSYDALTAITETAITYDAPTTETARRLLDTVCANYAGMPIITRDQALSCLGSTLDLPIGTPSEEERDILLTLESHLAQTIVGQERAIRAIAIALRRMRANLTDTSRPVASFLFLGPSGVGKTETAKTLAQVYFKGADQMMRLDMSEYAHEHSLEDLLGSPDRPSILEQHLALHSRGLILLDEFEKAHEHVKQLFLQILAEGTCTTYDGSPLRFRQHLIIATSNAGSELIARTSEKRAMVPALDSDIIAHIIQTGTLSAELIGRFGDVILFDALTHSDEITIANQIMTRIIQKTTERGFTLQIAPAVTELIVAQAHNSTFGARPLRHHIEHTIEDIIATHIIRGDVKPGDTITIGETDLVQNDIKRTEVK